MAALEQAADRARQSITDLLLKLRQGTPDAMDRLFPLVYEQLRRIAHRQLQGERSGHTLGTTGLVHETYLKLVDQTRVEWRDRGHFFALAARAMRQILVDYARRYRAQRRGGGMQRVSLTDGAAVEEQAELLLAVHEALERLAAMNERLSRVVVPLLRGAHRGGDRGGAGGDRAHRGTGLGEGQGMAVPGAPRLRGGQRKRSG